MFRLHRNAITANRPLNSGIVFGCSLENWEQRIAAILSQEYELWLAKDMNDPQPEFLSRLSFNLNSQSMGASRYTQMAGRGIDLVWHFSASQLQRIEDFRQGKEPWFQIRNRLVVHAQAIMTDGSLHGQAYFADETACDAETNSYPIKFKLDHKTWGQVLDDVGFKHIVLQELTIPVFPPEFKRAESHLKEAWDHHRAGRERPALLSCFNAFECLGFDLTGAADLKRADVLAFLMDGKESEKQEKIKALWKAVGDYCHLGRHDRGPQVHLNHADGELALVCATVLLNYLAR